MVQESDPLKRFDEPGNFFGRIRDVTSPPLPSHEEAVASERAHRSPSSIRADMRQTRAQIDQTMEDLHNHLRPNAILSRVAHSVQHHIEQGAKSMLQAIKDNPLPATVIGAGLLMMLSRRYGSSHVSKWVGLSPPVRPESEFHTSPMERTRDAISHTVSSVKGKVGDISHSSGEVIKDAASAVGGKLRDATSATSDAVRQASTYSKDKASQFGHQMRDGAHQSAEWIDDMIHEYPLAAGAACFALGLAGGFALPSSRRENKLVGPTRDRVMRQARAAGADLIQKGEAAAERAVEVASAAVKEQADIARRSASSTSASSTSDGVAHSPTASNPRRWEDTHRRGPT